MPVPMTASVPSAVGWLQSPVRMRMRPGAIGSSGVWPYINPVRVAGLRRDRVGVGEPSAGAPARSVKWSSVVRLVPRCCDRAVGGEGETDLL